MKGSRRATMADNIRAKILELHDELVEHECDLENLAPGRFRQEKERKIMLVSAKIASLNRALVRCTQEPTRPLLDVLLPRSLWVVEPVVGVA